MKYNINMILMVGVLIATPFTAFADDISCFRDACVGKSVDTLGPKWVKNTEVFRDGCYKQSSRYDLKVEEPYKEVWLVYDEVAESITTINITRNVDGDFRTTEQVYKDIIELHGEPDAIREDSPSFKMYAYNKGDIQSVYTVLSSCRNFRDIEEERKCTVEKSMYQFELSNTRRDLATERESSTRLRRCNMDMEIK